MDINSKSLSNDVRMDKSEVMKYVYQEYSSFMSGNNEISGFSNYDMEDKNNLFLTFLNENIPDRRYQLKEVISDGTGMVGFDMSDPSDSTSIPITKIVTGKITSQKAIASAPKQLASPAQANAAKAGTTCIRCGGYNPYGENVAEESYICYSCRN